MGSALDTFNDFMNATERAVLTGPGDLINEAVKRSYLLKEYLRGREYTDVVQGGTKITDQVMFDEKGTYDHVQPNQVHVWKNPQVLTEWEIPWRFALDHMSWTDQEIELQMPDGLGRAARHRVLKRVKAAKERRVVTSTINGLEDEFFAVPSSASMEATNGLKPQSIPALINESSNGIHEGWGGLTKQGINPATESRWRPQQVTYDNGVAANADVTDTTTLHTPIIEAFDEMYYLVGYDTLPGHESQGESYSNATMILCSREGINIYKQAMRSAQDTYVTPSRQDPAYNRPLYSGIPLHYVSNLDSAGLYPNTAANGTGTPDVVGGTATNQGPRYYWLNRKYHKPVFHSKRYMYRNPVRTHPNQPSTHIQVVDCWHNYPAQSLQRHGIVSPT